MERVRGVIVVMSVPMRRGILLLPLGDKAYQLVSYFSEICAQMGCHVAHHVLR